MNLSKLLGVAAMMAAKTDEYRRCYYLGSEPRHQINMPKVREQKQLREYTYKGHTIMASSKTDAKFRLRKEGKV